MRYLPFLLFVFFGVTVAAQDVPIRDRRPSSVNQDIPLADKRPGQFPGKEITINDYKIISHERDTTFLDTTLTIQKEYKYTYLRKDDFELMPFANVGQPYNNLGVNFERNSMYPRMGASAKHFGYKEVEDINYYNVATPMSDLFFKTTFEQGQLLDALLTFNTSRRFNFSIAYTGFRSLGKYQFNQAQSGRFRTTANYETKNKRYNIRAHIAAQDIETEENGGLTTKEEQFESGDENFRDRIKIDIRFNDAQGKILGKRYYFDHRYKFIRTEQDSSQVEKTSLGIGHQFSYETKHYKYTQTGPDEYFGEALISSISDRANLKTMFNQVSADFYNAILGSLQGNISVYNYNYFFNSILITDEQRIQNQLKGEEIALGARYAKQIGGFQIEGDVKYNLVGDLTGSIIDASASYRLNEKNKLAFSIHSSSRMPDFNYLLYQSDYEAYNWQNVDTFKKENINSLHFEFDSEFWGALTAKYTTIGNYTYFGVDPDQPIEEGREQENIGPLQEDNSVGHLKVKYNNEFRLGGFALNNTVMYQSVSQTNEVLNVPQLVTRNTLYFSSDVFKKAMYIQTGVTFKYFTAYNMNAYNSLLGEFYTQNNEELGGFPMLDFFINARVKQTRIFLKAEHFNSGFSGTNSFYSAPNYPYRDFVIRFGLVWNFFS